MDKDKEFYDSLRDLRVWSSINDLLWKQNIHSTSLTNTILISIQCVTCITTLLLNGHTYLRGLLLGINIGCLLGVVISNLVSNHYRRKANTKFESEVFPFIKANLK